MNFMNWIKELSTFLLSIKAIYLFPSPADIMLSLSRSHISNQVLFSGTKEKKKSRLDLIENVMMYTVI